MNGSWKIARMSDIEVRVHWTLIAYCVFVLLFPMPSSWQGFLWKSLVVVLIFGSVLAHEFGHAFCARFCDGESNQIVLWPLGGLAYVRLPDSPSAHFLTALAGPLVSLLLWVGASMLAHYLDNWAAMVAQSIAAMNWMLWLFNLIPAYPLDGGRMLQALIWHHLGYARSMWYCVHLAFVCAVMMFIWAFGWSSDAHGDMLLTGVAVFVFMSAWQQREILKHQESSTEFWSERPGVAWNHPYRDRDPTKPSIWQRLWKSKTKTPRSRTKSSHATSKDSFMRDRVDPILDKINREGIESLTDDERRILDQARSIIDKKTNR